MACGNARLELRKAVKLSQATKDGQAMDFPEWCLVRAAGSDSYKATLLGGSLSKFCLLLRQKVTLSQL